MKKALILALRELQNYLQDKADLAFSLLLPIVTFALIYGAFGGDELFHGTAYIVNEDIGGTYATQLVDSIESEDSLDVEILSREEADLKLDRADVNLVFLIPSDFSGNLISGQPVELTFLQRGNGGQEGQIVASMIRGAVSELSQSFVVIEQVKQAVADYDIADEQITLTTLNMLEEERESPLIGIEEVSAGTKPNTVKEFLPGIVTMYVLFSISISAAAIVDERKKGTLERLLTTRLSIGQLFLGKFISSIFRGFIQTLILLVLSYAVFQIFTPLSFLESLVIALLFAMACSGIGLVIASVARTQDSATWIGVFFTMATVMLGGTFFEISEGTVLYGISKISLNGYANDAFKTLIAEGGSITDLGLEMAVLAGVAVVGLIVSRLLFRALPKGK